MFETFVGFRFLKPKRKQALVSVLTLISVIGVAVGVATLIIVISVISGLQEDLRAKILGAYSHILVLSFNPTITEYGQVMETAGNIEGVTGVSPFVYSEVMLTSGSGVSGAVLRGVDPETVGKVTNLADSMVQGDLADLGKNLDAADTAPQDMTRLPFVVLGVHLASSLRVFVGETVNVVSPLGESTPMGQVPRMQKFRVGGIFESGMYEFDAKFAFIHIRAAQRFFRIGDAVSGIEVKVDDVMRAKQIAAVLQSELKYPYRAKDWMEMNKNLLSAL